MLVTKHSFLYFQAIRRGMVEPSGIEPLTSCVQGRRTHSEAMAPYTDLPHPITNGRSCQIRTDDLALFRGSIEPTELQAQSSLTGLNPSRFLASESSNSCVLTSRR